MRPGEAQGWLKEGIPKQIKLGPGVRARVLSFKCHFGRPEGDVAGGRRGPKGVPFRSNCLFGALPGYEVVLPGRVLEALPKQAIKIMRK